MITGAGAAPASTRKWGDPEAAAGVARAVECLVIVDYAPVADGKDMVHAGFAVKDVQNAVRQLILGRLDIS